MYRTGATSEAAYDSEAIALESANRILEDARMYSVVSVELVTYEVVESVKQIKQLEFAARK